MIVYHATNAEPFARFDPALIGSSTDDGHMGAGFYFSTDTKIKMNSRTLITAKVTLQSPLTVKCTSWFVSKWKTVCAAVGLQCELRGQALTDELKKLGFDGVILDYSPLGYCHQEVMVIDADNITILQ